MSAPLKKYISFFPLTMIVVGSCIGSGIFISPSDVAAQLGSGYQLILVWLIGGVVALTGALTFGELAARYPGTGGVYIFLREAYGDFVAFLYGWSILTVITSGAIAALCIAFSRYMAIIFDVPASFHIPIALVALFCATIINVMGVKWSALFSSGMTLIKIAGIGLVVLICFLYGQNMIENVGYTPPKTTKISFGLALIGVLWSYGGWHHASYIGGEVQNARKILPKAMITGAIIVTVVYVLMNLAYLSVLTVGEIATSSAVASDALLRVTAHGGVFVAILIALSTFGSAGIYTLSAPRIYFKMGEDKVFFSWLADVHPKYGTPAKAIILQSLWAAVLLIFWQTFESLTTYVVFMDWIFMTMAAAAVFIFRKTLGVPSKESFNVSPYPVVPIIFIGISVWFLVSTLIGRPTQALAGLILMVLGMPFYLQLKKMNQKSGS